MTLNEAILKVLRTPLKRDCKEAYDMVKAAGYELMKGKYGYVVINKNNGGNYVCLTVEYPWMGYTYFHLGSSDRRVRKPEAIDFVGVLNAKPNTAYRRAEMWQGQESEALYKARALRDCKMMIRHYKDDIEVIKKQMITLMEKLEYYAESKAYYEEALKEKRKEYGLK